MKPAIRILVLAMAVFAFGSVASAQHAAVAMRQTRATSDPTTGGHPQPFSLRGTIRVTSGNPTSSAKVTGDIRLLELLVVVRQAPRR